MWRIALIVTSLFVVPGSSNPAAFCRCAQRSLAQYFNDAGIVVIGRVTLLSRVPETATRAERIEIRVAPQFRPGPFKGSLEGITLATSTSSAGCGVPVAVNRVYVLFATRDPADSTLAWFDTCSGSREYPARPGDPFTSFVDVADNRVVTTLFELADAPVVAASQQSPTDFHISPACWTSPRIAHQGSPPADLRDRVRLTRLTGPLPGPGGVMSPNGAYRAWVPSPDDRTTGGAAPYTLIDNGTLHLVRLDLEGAIAPPALQWVNEKLLFVRAAWGRVQFTDLLLDVEQARLVYEEAARYAEDAFHQYHGACLGQCPCQPVPGSADSLETPPRHEPLPGEYDGLARLQAGNLAFLDLDWDGRMFTEAGGTRFVVSRLKGAMGREEYPMTVREVRKVGNAHWIEVLLYAENPCVRPDAEPVHRGWVPAFSRAGRLVAGTWPGGC